MEWASVNLDRCSLEKQHDFRASPGGLPKGVLKWPVYRASFDRQWSISIQHFASPVVLYRAILGLKDYEQCRVVKEKNPRTKPIFIWQAMPEIYDAITTRIMRGFQNLEDVPPVLPFFHVEWLRTLNFKLVI